MPQPLERLLERRRRSLTYDYDVPGPGPRRGDYLISQGRKGPGTVYQVLTSRLVQRKNSTAEPRYAMMVRVLADLKQGESCDLDPRRRVFPLYWYSRDKKKQSFESYMKRGMA